MMDMLGIRARNVLHTLVRLHIKTGRPVGSAAIAKGLKGRWSSATIRTDLAALEEMGCVEQPHASAGRIPTAFGYRSFVEQLLADLRRDCVRADIGELAMTQGELGSRLRNASAVLAHRSSLVGIVLSQGVARSALDHLQFVRIGERRVVAVVATRAGAVMHKPLELESDVSSGDLEALNGYVAAHLRGLALHAVRDRIRAEIEGQGEQARVLSQRLLELASRALEDAEADGDVYIAGRQQILACRDFDDLDRLRGLLQAMEQKELWLRVLNASLSQPGIIVHLGDRDLPVSIDECALVTAPFGLPDGVRGRVGVLGPLRMDYARVFALVQAASAALSS